MLLAAAAKVCCRQILRQASAAQHQLIGSIGGKEELVDPVVPIDLHHRPQVILVVAVAAVLIFHLHCDDVAAVFSQIWAQAVKQLLVVGCHLLQKQRIVAAQGKTRSV